MSPKNTTTVLKGLTILLTLLLLGLGVYTFSFQRQVQNNEARLEQEKKEIQEELSLEIAKYNRILSEKNELNRQLEATRSELEALKKQVETNTVTQRTIESYRAELRRLRGERVNLVRQNDSLQRLNEALVTLQEETRQSLDSIERKQDRLEAENQVLLERVAEASKVTASNLTVRGVIQRTSGRLLATQRARRARMINVRFDVNENPLAEEADLPFYTQVLNQQGQLIGSKREISFSDGTTIIYNTRTVVSYKKERTGVSELVLPVQRFDPGTYTINVYLGNRLVLSDQLILK